MTKKIMPNHREVNSCYNCIYSDLEDFYYDEYKIKCTIFLITTYQLMICDAWKKEKEA